jgi:molybdate transport system permease protein
MIRPSSFVLRHASSPWGPAGAAATVIYVVFIGLPVLALLVRAAQQEAFIASLTSPLALQALQLSLVTSAISIMIVVLVGTPFAHLLARSDSFLLKVLDSMVELPIVLPPVVAGVAMLMAFGRQGLIGPALSELGIILPFTTTAVILAQIFVAAPFYIRASKLGFQSVDPDYENVSQTLGVSPWRTFWRLTLPMASPSILTGVALGWARAISEFGATIMFAGNLTGETQDHASRYHDRYGEQPGRSPGFVGAALDWVAADIGGAGLDGPGTGQAQQ